MEMSTISKTTPNSNQSSKTNDGLNPVADLPPISTLTPPVTIYGVSPQLYIGQNGSSRASFGYSSSILGIATQDNSQLQLAPTFCFFNRNMKIYTGANISTFELGGNGIERGVITYGEYSPSNYLFALTHRAGPQLTIYSDRVNVNTGFEIYTGSIAEMRIGADVSNKVTLVYEDLIQKLQIDKDVEITRTSTTMHLQLQNNDNDAAERKCRFDYFETGNPGEEGGALSINIPANTRSVPATAGVSVLLFNDEIVLSAKEVQLQGSLLNTNSYLYLNNFKSLSNTQPPPETWVPKITFTTPGASSITYTTQFGRIWKYGNVSYINFRILATLTTTVGTNLRIRAVDPLFSFPLVTNQSTIRMSPTSVIASIRYDLNSFSELNQTNPDWIVTILTNGAGFPNHTAWVTGVSTFDIDFYGDGFLCHA